MPKTDSLRSVLHSQLILIGALLVLLIATAATYCFYLSNSDGIEDAAHLQADVNAFMLSARSLRVIQHQIRDADTAARLDEASESAFVAFRRSAQYLDEMRANPIADGRGDAGARLRVLLARFGDLHAEMVDEFRGYQLAARKYNAWVGRLDARADRLDSRLTDALGVYAASIAQQAETLDWADEAEALLALNRAIGQFRRSPTDPPVAIDDENDDGPCFPGANPLAGCEAPIDIAALSAQVAYVDHVRREMTRLGDELQRVDAAYGAMMTRFAAYEADIVGLLNGYRAERQEQSGNAVIGFFVFAALILILPATHFLRARRAYAGLVQRLRRLEHALYARVRGERADWREDFGDDLAGIADAARHFADAADERNRRLDAARNEAVALAAEAQAAAQAKEDFLASMSHELRTPLNAVIGFSQMLAMPKLGRAKTREYAQLIERSGHMLLSIVNNVLMYSALNNRGVHAAPTVFSPRAQIDGVATIVQEALREKGCVIENALPEDLRIRADVAAFRQIFSNALSNAVKFSENGGRVRVYCEVVGPTRIRVLVRDWGRGIAAERVPQVLRPFETDGGPDNRSFGGTGLGLPIMSALAEIHGEPLHLVSVEGEGTTVGATFERASAASAEPTSADDTPAVAAVG